MLIFGYQNLPMLLLFRKYAVRVFYVVLIIHCMAIYFEAGFLRNLTKYLLIPCLIAWLHANPGKKAGIPVFMGLYFSWFGDIVLTSRHDLAFLIGMLCFMTAHICYSIRFAKLQDPLSSRLREAFSAAIILILLSVIVFSLINPNLGSLRVPVIVYMAVISIMAILAANTAGNQSLRAIAFRSFIPGAALFVSSDALLALNKFLVHDPMLDIVVMATYGGAQYFLARGFDQAPI